MSRTCTRDAAGQAGRGAVIPSKIHTLSSSGMRCVATARMRARLVVTQCGRPGDLAFTLINSVSQSAVWTESGPTDTRRGAGWRRSRRL